MRNIILKTSVAAAILSASMVAGVANAANHREAPSSALDKIADITDWYTFKSYDRPSHTVMMLGTDGLQEPANGPNFFPFHNEIKYLMKVDNNHDARDDVIFEFFFSELDTDRAPFGNNRFRFPESFTGFSGIAADVCIAIPSIPGTGVTCAVPIAGTGSQGRTGPVNQPLPVWEQHSGFVIPQPIGSLTGSSGGEPGPGLGLGEPQTFIMRLIRGASTSSPVTTQYGPFRVVPANMGPRSVADHIALSKTGIFNVALPGGTGKVFAGTTDDPFPVALGTSFDTIAYSLVCGGGVNIPTVEISQAGNCQANDVDGYNVNTIAIEVPTSLLASGGSPVIGTYGTSERPIKKVYNTIPGGSPQFTRSSGGSTNRLDLLARSDFKQIARMGNPLFNELIVGTGCKDIFAENDADEDATVNGCRGLGTNAVDRARLGGFDRYPDIASFVLDPYLPRLVNALVQTQVPLIGCNAIGDLNGSLPLLGGGTALPTLPLLGGLALPLVGGVGGLPGVGGVPQLTLGCATGALEAPDANKASAILPGRTGRDDMLLFTNYRAFNKEFSQLTGRPQQATIGSDPVADLLRYDSSVPPTSPLLRKRMGPLDLGILNVLGLPVARVISNDPAGWPNGRRPSDDVVDGVVRVEMGVLDEAFMAQLLPRGVGAAPHIVNNLIGDASQGNDVGFIANIRYGTDLAGYTNTFPFVVFANPGSNSRHIDVGELGCLLSPVGTVCPGPSGGAPL